MCEPVFRSKWTEFEIYCVTMAMRGRGQDDAVAANYREE